MKNDSVKRIVPCESLIFETHYMQLPCRHDILCRQLSRDMFLTESTDNSSFNDCLCHFSSNFLLLDKLSVPFRSFFEKENKRKRVVPTVKYF